ncbi:hypothetical protein PFICI_13695 [Pestalotiopsis fici W106-1]|uniref:Uncharacterized protein n=1 Tax=Pestalotiopsis fici (strain W106-1 / CGMCC3.15140) TaxID=1229662 RepID=W3WQU8_PESFW|nr:uncharacterized protein PFICI_13695 [Pestalotiopsis fici W106-1]ETS75211.1 hypothetical protein PFICI_13695 [Pestalotiopsis fici W106-1]
MTTLQNAKPELPMRAESLTRMLALEKKYKIQRLQDIGSTPPLTPLGAPITRSASSAQPNPVLKARHASALPPAPRQRPHMMMKASRRASALPSLSISVPHSVSSAVAVRTDDEKDAQSPIEPGPQKEPPKDTVERTKTVTFSEPEGDEEEAQFSDQSSICQSPSWAVYGQSKKKDKKREAAEKKKEENRQEKAGRKSFTRRLSKAPPQSTAQGRPSISTERSLSAPELDQHQKLSDRNLSRTTSHYPPDSMTNHHNLLKHPAAEENSKPKSKGFFSGFRLPGNSSNTSQKTDSSARASMEDVSSLRAGTAYALHKSGQRGDMDFLNPRKPPSILSNSSSSQSQSSQELKQTKERRSSNHGRSNSLLARLKGPSYLYAKHSDSSEEATQKRPESAGKTESLADTHTVSQSATHAVPAAAPNVPQSNDQREGGQTIRGRQLQVQANILQSRDSSSDSGRGDFVNTRHLYTRHQVPEAPIANESRRRPPNKKMQAGGQQPESSALPIPSPRQALFDNSNDHHAKETRRNFVHVGQPQSPVQPQVRMAEVPSPAMSPRSNRSYASVYTDAVDQLSESHSFHTESEKFSDHAHATIIRPDSRRGDRNGLGPNRIGLKPIAPPASTHDHGELRRSPRVTEMRGPRVTSRRDGRLSETDETSTAAAQYDDQTHRAPKPSDYFTFVSESYAPPSLELRSPVQDECQENEPVEDMYEDEDLVWVTDADATREGERIDEARDKEQQKAIDGTESEEICDSPTLSAHDRESFVPPLDGLGTYSAAPTSLEKNNLVRVTLEDGPSQTVSERSSSSTHNDPPHSPSPATTPDISRPQSQRGSSLDIARGRTNEGKLGDERPSKRTYRSKMTDLSLSETRGLETHVQDKSGDRHTISLDAEHSDGTTRGGTPEHVLSRSSSIRSPSLRAFAEPLLEEEAENDEGPLKRQPLAPKALSSIDLSTNSSLLHDRLPSSTLKRNKAAASSVSLPNSPPTEMEIETPHPLRSAMKPPRYDSSSSQEASGIISAGAAYLKEARKAAPTPGGPSNRTVRPMYTPRVSLSHQKAGMSEKKGDPMAKVLVQCCNCHFFHDMPSRVYECMAKPDSVIEDKLLGVSAAITTTVRCPWCAHGMTTSCCSGYAALVYLKEKLHGQ